MENFQNNSEYRLHFCIFALLIMSKPSQTYLISWFKRVLFALSLLSLTRIFFIFYLFPYFSNAPLNQIPLVLTFGVLFDVQSMVYFLGPFHLFSLIPPLFKIKWHKNITLILFITGLSAMLLLNLIDFEFFKIKSRRSGIELFSLLSDKSNPLFSYIYHYWWLSLGFFALVFVIWKLYPAKSADSISPNGKKWILNFILIAAILFLGARGSVGIKPLRSFDAARFVDPAWVAATINSPTQLLTSYASSVPKPLHYFSDEVCLNEIHPVQSVTPYFPENRKPNVVLIILESFGRDYCGFLNKEPRFTPFLDSLAAQSLVFFNAYSSGVTSMESIPAIFASVPSLMEVPYINSNFQSNRINGVHHYLSKAGYDCSFYYGAVNGSMGFDNFLKISGPISYFGLDEFRLKKGRRDFDGHWGIWDEPFLQYFAEELGSKKEPFFSSVFTLSSHDPYQLPDQYKNKFKGGHLPIYKTVEYTDHSLSLFFKKAETQAWFKNTIFILTADHPSHSVNEYYYSPTGKFEIPLMLYAPGLISPGVREDITASHPDIFPTIMRLTGNRSAFFSLGKDLLDSTERHSIQMSDGLAQLIDYPYCFRLYPDGSNEMYYHPKYVPNKKIRWVLTPEEQQNRERLDRELKMKMQIYFNSLINNRFFVEDPSQP